MSLPVYSNNSAVRRFEPSSAAKIRDSPPWAALNRTGELGKISLKDPAGAIAFMVLGD